MKGTAIFLCICIFGLIISLLIPISLSTEETIDIAFTTDKTIYSANESVLMIMTVTNTGNQNITLTNPASHVRIYNDKGEDVFAFFDYRSLRSDIFRENISAGETIEYLNATWNITDTEGKHLPSGNYTLNATFSRLNESFESISINKLITIQVVDIEKTQTPGFELPLTLVTLVFFVILKTKILRRRF